MSAADETLQAIVEFFAAGVLGCREENQPFRAKNHWTEVRIKVVGPLHHGALADRQDQRHGNTVGVPNDGLQAHGVSIQALENVEWFTTLARRHCRCRLRRRGQGKRRLKTIVIHNY